MSFLKNTFYLNIPYSYEFFISKNIFIKNILNITCYKTNSKEYFCFFINLDNNLFYMSEYTNAFIFKHNKFDINFTFFQNFLKKNIYSWNSMFFVKIKFKGKGYKIKLYKKNKIMIFFFGRSHVCIFKFTNIKLVKLGKYKFILAYHNLKKLKDQIKKIIKIRKINIYTLRGLRTSKQIIFKKKGKKSSSI